MSEKKKRVGSTGRETRGNDNRQSEDANPPPRRKSERKSNQENQESKLPASAPVEKKSITLKKIVPRKTMPASPSSGFRHSPRSSSASSGFHQTPRLTGISALTRRSSRISTNAEKENAGKRTLQSASPCSSSASTPVLQSTTVTSQITTSSETMEKAVLSPVINGCDPGLLDERDLIMSKKVRRSYTRLEMSLVRSPLSYNGSFSQSATSDSSTPNNSRSDRRSFFGFEKLMTPEALVDVSPVKLVTAEERLSVTRKETAADSSPKERDLDIPGVALVKEKRKKRKVPQIAMSDLDEWAAQMNAQFEEAEKFNLLVE